MREFIITRNVWTGHVIQVMEDGKTCGWFDVTYRGTMKRNMEGDWYEDYHDPTSYQRHIREVGSQYGITEVMLQRITSIAMPRRRKTNATAEGTQLMFPSYILWEGLCCFDGPMRLIEVSAVPVFLTPLSERLSTVMYGSVNVGDDRYAKYYPG